MTNYIKYPSIENSYNNRYISKMVEHCGDMSDVRFVIHEKLDGCNIKLQFNPDGRVCVGKRNSWLEYGQKFNDIWNTLDRYDFSGVKRYSAQTGKIITLYGELYGEGIQNRVRYGEKKIAIFEMWADSELITQKKLGVLLEKLDIVHLSPPKLAIVTGLGAALAYLETFDSKILNEENNTAEGIVIKPYDEVLSYGHDIFMLKKKSSKFEERPRKAKKPSLVSSEFKRVKAMFNLYMNQNRVASVFSKEGPIQEPSQIGHYIKLVVEDAKVDFLKDHPDLELSKDDMTKIYKASGGTIAKYVKDRLIPE